MNNINLSIKEAIIHFWKTRDLQNVNQGGKNGIKDYGNRSAVTGGAQLDGFINVFKEFIVSEGIPEDSVIIKSPTLPGFFRPTKEWDIVIIAGKRLIAVIELKSHIGPSFGNNFNNRIEEALGSATDLWTAYREGAFKPSQRPWLGYFLVLEDHPGSISSVKINSSLFPAFSVFNETSYKDRYCLFCERLIRERLYDSACVLLSNRNDGLKGEYTEPSEELSIESFFKSIRAKIKSAID
ncbi:MAG: restriction endonuclease [Spirochaetes bacterium GWF1_51_8]|nr:MAG: restriction endonuclease [Spirochaetes bacterium GWF1_51_8]